MERASTILNLCSIYNALCHILVISIKRHGGVQLLACYQSLFEHSHSSDAAHFINGAS